MTTAQGTRSVYKEFQIEEYTLKDEPFYVPIADEIELFEAGGDVRAWPKEPREIKLHT